MRGCYFVLSFFFFNFCRWVRNVTSRWLSCLFYDVDSISHKDNSQLHLSRASDGKSSKSRYSESECGVGSLRVPSACNERPASGWFTTNSAPRDSRAVSRGVVFWGNSGAPKMIRASGVNDQISPSAGIYSPISQLAAPRDLITRSRLCACTYCVYDRTYTGAAHTCCRAARDIFHFRHREQTTWVSI